MIDPDWVTGHMFGRQEHVRGIRAVRQDMYYFNKMFMAHTLFPREQTKKFINHLYTTTKPLNINKARDYLKNNSEVIKDEHSWFFNIRRHGIEVFEDKFNYDLSWLK